MTARNDEFKWLTNGAVERAAQVSELTDRLLSNLHDHITRLQTRSRRFLPFGYGCHQQAVGYGEIVHQLTRERLNFQSIKNTDSDIRRGLAPEHVFDEVFPALLTILQGQAVGSADR